MDGTLFACVFSHNHSWVRLSQSVRLPSRSEKPTESLSTAATAFGSLSMAARFRVAVNSGDHFRLQVAASPPQQPSLVLCRL
jgi:hypothetical protein